MFISWKCWQEFHASPQIEHTPHIVLSIYIHIWNVLSIYGYVGYHEVLTEMFLYHFRDKNFFRFPKYFSGFGDISWIFKLVSDLNKSI